MSATHATSGAKRTGRATLVREFLATQKLPKSAREILDAIEPGGCITLMCATLGTLTRGGFVLRHGEGQGNIRYTIGYKRGRRVSEIAAPTPRPKSSAPHVRTQLTAAESARANKAAATPAPRLNFIASLGTVCAGNAARREASARIGADIAAFEKRGGKVERLGTTQTLRHIGVNNKELT